MGKTTLFLIALLVLPLTVFAADSVYIQSVKAKIMNEPNFKSGEVGVANKGDKLTVTEKGDGWIKVSSASLSGWVNKLCVSDSPPMDKIALVTAESANLEEKSRKRASAMTSAAAARGLSDEDRKRLTEAGKADYRALIELERVGAGISKADVDAFSNQDVNP
jgi:hypothetical protein